MTASSICLACGGSALYQALDLGKQPLANCLLPDNDTPYSAYSLGLMACADCGHGQLPFFVPPSELFAHYLYASGTSTSLGNYFDWFTSETVRHFSAGAPVLELACNDGSLLRRFKKRGFDVYGVDPAENLVDAAKAEGLNVLCDYWPCSGLEGRKFDLIVAMNVVAHTPDPLTFLKGVERALSDSGVCVVQTSQARMLLNGEFDTIYHEHYSFFTPGSFNALATRAGLKLVKISLVDIHGVSYAFVLTKAGSTRDVGDFLETAPYAVKDPNIADKVNGSRALYASFAAAAQARMARVRDVINSHRAAGKAVCFVGAAAKAMVFLHASGIVPDRIFDEAQLKIGRYIPALGKKIEALGEIANIGKKPLVVISAWNFKNELAAKTRKILPDGANFLVYFPEVEEF